MVPSMRQRSLTHVGLVASMALALFTTTGCQSVRNVFSNPAGITALAKDVTYVGVSLAIKNDPALKPKFVLAHQSLDILVKSGKVDGVTIMGILNGLPVRQLQSQNGQLVITSGAILFDLLVGGSIDVTKSQNVLAFAIGMDEGLRAALEIP
jgi:hypothetical protein